MTTKEHIKTEIDQMPDELVAKVHLFIKSLKKKENTKKVPFHTYKLNGAFDHVNIRRKAYE